MTAMSAASAPSSTGSSTSTTTISALRSIIESARDDTGGSLKEFTVLSAQIDPYRLDTPANHEVGRWFAAQMDRLNLLTKQIHLRGIHYAFLGSTTMPNGKPYANTNENWEWLQNSAAKAARWLGYVPFEAITDARNEPPVIHIRDRLVDAVSTHISTTAYIEKPSLVSANPYAGIYGFEREQPYRLALYGEKTSLAPILGPISDRLGADLFLPTGEISDTQLHAMAKAGAEDGRELIVFTVTDFDPSGWQMTVSIGRKLQALRDVLFPDLDFQVRPIALNGEQARHLNLPSTPLKKTEKRADKWRKYMGWEQTEIDALATLQPGVLRRIVNDAVAPFYDHTLVRRVFAAKAEWEREANEQLREQIDTEHMEALKADAEQQIAHMCDELYEIEKTIEAAMRGLRIDLPKPEIPKPEINKSLQGKPLLSSEWSWSDQTRALIARKSYADEARHD